MPIGSLLKGLSAGVQAVFARIDDWGDRVQQWLDRTAEGPWRVWLRPVLVSLAVTVATVLVLRLLLAGLGHVGGTGRWAGAVLTMVLAAVLLIVVLRNVMVAVVQPDQRRYFLIAVLTSGGALLLGVEAFASLSIALAGHGSPLWTAERYYLRQLVQAVPLLHIADRLEWTERPVLPGLGGRVLTLAFTLLVIPPLLRVGLALYEYVEKHTQDRRDASAIAERVRGIGTGLGDEGVPVVMILAAGAGALWGVLHLGAQRPTLWSLGGLAAALTVLAALVAGVLASPLLLTLHNKRSLVAVLPAVGLVWFDSPYRRMLLPAAAHWGAWARLLATVVAFLVLLVVLNLLWADPELSDAVVGLVLVLGFLGAGAPVTGWLHTHFTWQPWGFPIDRPLGTAAQWFTVGYLHRAVARSVTRVPALGRYDVPDNGDGLRQDLRGYAMVAVQLVVAAGAVLTLLEDAGLATTRGGGGWSEATQALDTAASQIVSSLPGPDVSGILGWRPVTDFSGRWVGLVLIMAIVATVVFAGLPLIRTVLVWARLSGRRGPGGRLAALPAMVEKDLRAVVAFLAAEPRNVGQHQVFWRQTWAGNFRVTLGRSVLAAERRLVRAVADLSRMADLFGTGSPWYQAAELAVARTTDAYRAFLEARGPSRGEANPEAMAAARAALDTYARVVEGWQALLNADPVSTME